MTFKTFIFQLHKILGLITGVIIFIVAITGCCWTFKDEIENLYSDYEKIEQQNTPSLTPTEAKKLAKDIFPNKSVHGTVFGKPNEVIEVIFYDAEPLFYQSVFINPYSKKIVHIKDHLSGFFAFVLKGHTSLWLPPAIGEEIIGVSILLFLVLLISGFILWLPKKRKNLKQRLKFTWKTTTRWKRKNFDLHSIIGFYVCSLAFILALTGLMMSYNWVQKTVYLSFGGDKNPTFLIPKNESKKPLQAPSHLPIDYLLGTLKNKNPTADSFEIHYPHSESDCIYVEVTNSDGLYYDSDFLFYDQNTLKPIDSKTIYGSYKNAKLADKILRMNYDIHIGAIGGIAGKMIVFLISLLTASLPVTGFLLWYGRHYKKKKTK